jgi:hypothetical protein
VPADRTRARELYLRACASGFADACAGMVRRDFCRFDDAVTGLETLRARCKGNRVECMELNAAVVELRTDSEAVARLDAACAKKEAPACRARELLNAPAP